MITIHRPCISSIQLTTEASRKVQAPSLMPGLPSLVRLEIGTCLLIKLNPYGVKYGRTFETLGYSLADRQVQAPKSRGLEVASSHNYHRRDLANSDSCNRI